MAGQTFASGSAPPRPDPDADLIQDLANGAPDARSAALAQLMDRHLASIKSQAWHMLGDEMAAEDIAQETFLRAWTHAEKWQAGNAKFSTWLHRVAKNLCYDRLRKKKEIYSDSLPELQDMSPNTPQMMIANEAEKARKETLALALQSLPERQLAAITLCHYQNKSQIEAAEIMEIGVRAYESLLARGRKNLREQLAAVKAELLDQIGQS